MDFMSRSQLAQAVGVNIETLRYYERRGLIPEPKRRASGYRLYSPDYVKRIHFIQKAKTLGFTLEEIKALLQLRVAGDTTCDQVREKAERKTAEIERKISELQKMQSALKNLASSCRGGGPSGDCPFLDALESENF